MPITRYDASSTDSNTIAIEVGAGEYAKIIQSIGDFTLYHDTTIHADEYTGELAAATVGNSVEWTNELINVTKITFESLITGIPDVFYPNDNETAFVTGTPTSQQIAHTAGTNAFTFGSLWVTLLSSPNWGNPQFHWVTQDGNVNVGTLTGLNQHDIGLNDGDHIHLATGDNHVTIETGIDFRPGLK